MTDLSLKTTIEERQQQLHRREQMLILQAQQLEQFMLSFRQIRSMERLIMFLAGAVMGAVLFKAWAGL